MDRVRRRVPRAAGALFVFAVVNGVVVLLSWLVLPRVVSQSQSLVHDLPTYVGTLDRTHWTPFVVSPTTC